MFQAGTKVGVVCNNYNRPDREATRILTGEVLHVSRLGNGTFTYTLRIDFHDGWLITTTEDETLLFTTFH